jgi:hypothetical protein
MLWKDGNAKATPLKVYLEAVAVFETAKGRRYSSALQVFS